MIHALPFGLPCSEAMSVHARLVGIRSIENKKNPTARTNNKPRSNLVDGSNEVKIIIPLKIAKR